MCGFLCIYCLTFIELLKEHTLDTLDLFSVAMCLLRSFVFIPGHFLMGMFYIMNIFQSVTCIFVFLMRVLLGIQVLTLM